MPPQLPDRYRLQVRLGRDEDIEEWLASDTTLDRPVLVRALAAGAADERRDTFIAAARDLGVVPHPHLCEVYAAIATGPTPSVVLEWTGGVTLTDRLGAGEALAVDEFLPNAAGLAEALAALHARGIVHGAIDTGAVSFSAAHPAKLVGHGRRRRTTTAADDVAALARTLRAAITGSDGDAIPPSELVAGVPPSVDAALAAAEAGELDAAGLAAAMRAAPTTRAARGSGAVSWRWVAVVAAVVGVSFLVAAAGRLIEVDPDSPFLFPATPPRVDATSPIEPGPTPTTSGAPSGDLPLDLEVFDPFGDGTERDALLPQAVDGDPTTAWSTERYFSPLESLKPGVGLLIRTAAPPSAVEIHLGEGVAWELRWTSTNPPSLEDTERLASGTGIGAPTLVPVPRRDGGTWVLWLTRLPETAPDEYRGDVFETRFLS